MVQRHLLKSQKYWNCKVLLLGIITYTIIRLNSLFLLYTHFRRSHHHLVSGANPLVCSFKAYKVGFWFWIKCGSWCHVFMLFSSAHFWLINKHKNGSLKTNLSRDISFQTSRSNPYILP